MYERGEGVPSDLSQALQWYTAAGEAGEPRAILRLLRAYQVGELGVTPDPAMQRYWAEKARAAGVGQ